MVGPGSREIYKRDNLLGPEAAEACFYGTSRLGVHDEPRAAAAARGRLDTTRTQPATAGVVVVVVVVVVLVVGERSRAAGVRSHAGKRGARTDLVTCESSRVTRES